MTFVGSRRGLAIDWGAAAPFLLVGLLIVLRNPAPILRAEFWAEDGMEFFPLALTEGWRSLYTPVYGYHFLLSRMIAYLASLFPVIATPYIYAVGCLGFNALAIGYFSLDRFSWIIPSRPLRILACVLLATGPGAGEIMMNLCNLMTPLTLLALLILIEDPNRLSWPRFWGFIFLACSAGPVFLLSPLVIYLAWRNRDRRYLWLFISTCPVFLANVVGNHVIGSKNGLLNYHYAILIPKSLAENFSLRLFLLPILGATKTAKVMVATDAAFWSSCLAGAAALWLLWKRGLDPKVSGFWTDHQIVILSIGFACAISTFAGIAISRSYAVQQITRQIGDPLWHLRYAYLPGAVAILLWATILHRLLRIGPLYTGLVFVAFATIALNHLEQWQNYPPRRDAHWPEAAHLIQEAVNGRRQGALRNPVTVRVPVQPEYWNGGAIEFVISPD